MAMTVARFSPTVLTYLVEGAEICLVVRFLWISAFTGLIKSANNVEKEGGCICIPLLCWSV